MGCQYIDISDAMARGGLRMVVMGNVPSPWTEAAKGIFHLKRIEWSAVRLAYDNDAVVNWVGQRSAPIVVYEKDPPLSGWQDILLLAERLAPTPAMLPADPVQRARALALAGEFCNPGEFGWTRRLQLVHAGLAKSGGFSERVAGYLGKKYGYDPAAAGTYGPRVREMLGKFAGLLRAQRDAGTSYYLGGELSAVDVYSAAFMALVAPLPEAQCRMEPGLRAAFEWHDADTRAAIDPVLLEHRDMMYTKHLELPVSL